MSRHTHALRTAAIGFVSLCALVPLGSAQAKFKVLYSFAGGSDGTTPAAGVIKAKDGNIYGTTFFGGSAGYGTIFKIAPDGTESVLFTFTGDNTGKNPYSGLAMDSEGNLYGTTIDGGVNNSGTVFKLAPDGTETVLHAFSAGTDGLDPYGTVMLDKHGNLYGTTVRGGGGPCTSGRGDGCGIVFKITPRGKETILHAFGGGTDGAGPTGALAMDQEGNLYGATQGGSWGTSTIFRAAHDGSETVLYAFEGDEYSPLSGVVRDSEGNLFTATQGGDDFYGAIFKLTPDRMGTVLYSFTGGKDGGDPYNGTLGLDSSGDIYGTAYDGGSTNCASGCGTVFKLAPDSKLEVLHSFKGGKDGCNPNSGLLLTKKGLYGTASGCGANGYGTVFQLK